MPIIKIVLLVSFVRLVFILITIDALKFQLITSLSSVSITKIYLLVCNVKMEKFCRIINALNQWLRV